MALPRITSTLGFSTLLVATDFSARSKRGLSCATALARKSGATLVIAHVMSPDRWQFVSDDDVHPALCSERRLVEKRLSKILSSNELRGVSTDSVIRQGDFRRKLCEIAHERGVDLLIAATHGRKGLGKLVIGSDVEEVCHRTPCPVLLVGPLAEVTAGSAFEKLLFATDLSTSSLGALPLILAFAAQYKSRLKILRVFQSETKQASDYDFALAQMKEEILPAITARAGLVAQPDLEVTFGDVNQSIVAAASEWGADVIGIGAHRPGTLSTHLPGDLAYAVACDASCPVLTIVD